MIIPRIYTDESGETHFGNVDVPIKDSGYIGFLSETLPVTGIIFRETPADIQL